MESNTPLVSVCMITYNHEKYIAQAIEGVLMQKTNFPIELVIGEDCSTDNTRKICEVYARNYSEIIKLLPLGRNLGMISNFIRTLKACQGKYIALCEGDDYWICPSKLQKQMDLLKNSPGVVGIANRTIVKNEIINKFYPRESDLYNETINIMDLLKGYTPYHTSSLFFMNGIIAFDKVKNDITLNFMLCSKGEIKYINDYLGVYRKQPSGVSNIRRSYLQKIFLRIQNFLSINKELDHGIFQKLLEKEIISASTHVKIKNIKEVIYFLFYIGKSTKNATYIRYMYYCFFYALINRLFKRRKKFLLKKNTIL